MSNLISTSNIASGSIIYPEHVLRSIQALRGETDTLFILSGSLIVSASDVRYPNLLENNSPVALVAYNTSSGNFYYTTTSIGSGSGGGGAQGVQGPQGSIGTQGSTGAGTQGAQGLIGMLGSQGVQGVQGLTGNGTQGTQGAQGLLGSQGSTGTGVQGAQGIQGLQGATGTQGLTGTQGSTGTGTQGAQGVQGVQGLTGTQGSTGAQGSTGTGTQGAQGVQGIQGTTGTQGSTGAQGAQGVQGVQGVQGTLGAQGTDGSFGGATFNYTYDTTLTAADPGQGKVRLSSATENAATSMYIDDLDDNGSDLSTFLQTIDSVTSAIKGYVRIANRTDATQFLLFQISDLVDNTGWWTLSVTNQASSATSPFTNLEDIIVSFVTTGDKGVQGAQGVQGLASSVQGPQGAQGTQGVQGLASSVQGPQGIQGTQGVQGTTSSIPTGIQKTYQITLNMSGGIIDTGGTPIASVLGPNGENKATLEGLGWSFSTPTSTRLTVGRPSSLQIQPIVNIMTHGNNSGNVYSKAPSGQATAGYTAVQTLSTGAWTTLDVYSINNTNTGCAASGATTVTVTFGLIS